MKFTKKEVGLVESYAIAFVASFVGLWNGGNHNLKHVAWAAGVAVFGPVWLSLKAKATKALAARAAKKTV